MSKSLFACLFGIVVAQTSLAGDDAKTTPRDALKFFNTVIGSWKGTATPSGTPQEMRQGFWIENQAWQWQFKKDDAWIDIEFKKSKYFLDGQLRYAGKKQYELTLHTVDKKAFTFKGELDNKTLTLESTDPKTKEERRLVFSFLHSNRFLYRYDVKTPERSFFKRVFQVGATKQGVAFATGSSGPECIVSGGLGTIEVVHQGTTYYVCCSGCRDEFEANPQKYIDEAKAKKKSQK